MWRPKIFSTILGLLVVFAAVPVEAEYFRQKESDIDPKVFHIEEKDFLGVKVDPELEVLDINGETKRLKDYTGLPLILVWSYFICDGSCSAVNAELKSLLEDMDLQTIGKDFRVLTLSFDANDTPESMATFREKLQLSRQMEKAWHFALIRDPEKIRPTTKSTGFNYFWAPQDKTFYHPNVFVFLSAEGRIMRYLYALTNTPKDVGLAILETRQNRFKANEVVDFVIGLCYSYNYKEGRYTYNIPLFVGAGSLLLGIFTLFGSIWIYRVRKSREEA